MNNRFKALAFVSILVNVQTIHATEELPCEDCLPRLGADTHSVTVSGLSSGGAMAVQYGVAFSASVKGIGVIAGVPYSCVKPYSTELGWYFSINGQIQQANNCMNEKANVSDLHEITLSNAKAGKIDSTRHIAEQKVWLFSGTEDKKVKRQVMDSLFEYYQELGVKESNLAYEYNQPAGHGFVSFIKDNTNSCDETDRPFVNHCADDFDTAKEIFAHLYGSLNMRASQENTSNRLFKFDQKPFFDTYPYMADEGFIYVPKGCAEKAGCRLHIAFHGCKQSADQFLQSGSPKDSYPRLTGYNEWAEANDIVVLYPQAKISYVSLNPHSCWDWWGYTDADFTLKSGRQLKAVNNMVSHLTAKKTLQF
ncbi:hypothetical protein CS022_04150 [Veronia nyctiphanis]|uniref:Poly(3-hydroxybutyrate) depolymerase n=1 Tax=Veronia nyctiphanis TaxID=1278244 RepID=A0A4V1LT79_9GAMM|nr:PHB depolymerase family esterase [Veronia nyctiphanis]RXJ74258.1 hypothetical protein CS022_04150 [Veronia nyctiphanis]